MLSKESAQILINLIVSHVRITPDGTEKADKTFAQFQKAMAELNAIIQAVDSDV